MKILFVKIVEGQVEKTKIYDEKFYDTLKSKTGDLYETMNNIVCFLSATEDFFGIRFSREEYNYESVLLKHFPSKTICLISLVDM